jgi:hypothetical protein
MRQPVRHELKTWPAMFQPVFDGIKPWELRQNDRDFQVGDTLHLCEWSPDAQRYTGRSIEADVTYIFPGGIFGLPLHVCIMTLANIRSVPPITGGT